MSLRLINTCCCLHLIMYLFPFHLQGSKVLPSPPPGLAPFYMYPPNDHFSPPPAHMGIPPVHIDPKTG